MGFFSRIFTGNKKTIAEKQIIGKNWNLIYRLISEIRSNPQIKKPGRICNALQMYGNSIIEKWLGYYPQDRRLQIIQYLESHETTMGRFTGLVQELCILIESPTFDRNLEDSKSIDEIRAIGQNLANIEETATGKNDIYLMQLFHSISLVIDSEVYSRIEWKWKGIAGWRP
jgi:hypothetical protein